MQTWKKLSMGAALAALAAFGVGGALAQDSTETPTPETQQGQIGRGRIATRFVRQVAQVVSTAIDQTPQEIFQAMNDGSTLAEVVTAAGGDVDALKMQITAELAAQIDAAVTAGSLTRERANTMLVQLAAAVDQAFAFTRPMARENIGHIGGQLVQWSVLSAVIDATDLTALEIWQAGQDGATLAETVMAAGGDVTAITAQVTADITAQIETAVTNGTLTQEQADALLVNVPQAVTRVFEQVREQGGRGGRGNGRDGAPGMGGRGQGRGDGDGGFFFDAPEVMPEATPNVGL